MVDVNRYNALQKKNLPKIESLEEEIKNFWNTHRMVSGGSKESKLLESLHDELRALDPMRGKDNHDGYNSSVYDSTQGYFKKTELDSFDAKVVGLLEKTLGKNWDFLQVRTIDFEREWPGFDERIFGKRKKIKRAEQDYVVVFERKNFDKSVERELANALRKNQNTPPIFDSPSYDPSKIVDDEVSLKKQMSKLIASSYSLRGIRFIPDIDYGHQGEAPFFDNQKYLLVVLEVEDKRMKRAKLRKELDSAKKAVSTAEKKLKAYK